MRQKHKRQSPTAGTALPLLFLIKRKFQNLASDQRFSEILMASLWALGARVLATLFALLSSIIIARIYGAEVMGIVAVTNSFVTVFTIFTLLGTNITILRLIPEHIAKHSFSSAYNIYRKTHRFVAVLSLILGTILYSLAPFIADRVFFKPRLTIFLAASAAFIWARSLMDLNTNAVRALRLLRTFALMQAFPHFSMLLLLLAASALSPAPHGPVYAQFCAWAVSASFGSLILRKAFRKRIRPTEEVPLTPMRSILSLASPMFISSSLLFLITNSGVIFLGVFKPEQDVGHYSAAVKLATLTSFILVAINTIAAPKFSELHSSGRLDELFHVARKSSKLIFYTTLPILFALLFLGRHILALLFGPTFTDAYPALVLLAISEFVNSASGSTGFFLNMTGHEKILRDIVVVASFINLLLNLLCIPTLGIVGSAFAAMVSTSLWNISILIYVKRKYGRLIAYFPGLSP